MATQSDMQSAYRSPDVPTWLTESSEPLTDDEVCIIWFFPSRFSFLAVSFFCECLANRSISSRATL